MVSKGLMILSIIVVIGMSYSSAQVDILSPNDDEDSVIDLIVPAATGGSSITNNTNSSDYWDNLDTPADINIGDLNQIGEYWVNESGDTMTGQLIVQSGNGKIVSTNGAGAISVQTSTGTAGAISFGNTADIGISSDGTVSGYNYDGTLVTKQKASNPAGEVEFLWLEEAGSWRFALPGSGADLATGNPRSMIIGYGAKNNASDVYCSHNGFDMIDCNTSGTGGDLGVTDDVQIGGKTYVGEMVQITGTIGEGINLLNDTATTSTADNNNAPPEINITGQFWRQGPGGGDKQVTANLKLEHNGLTSGLDQSAEFILQMIKDGTRYGGLNIQQYLGNTADTFFKISSDGDFFSTLWDTSIQSNSSNTYLEIKNSRANANIENAVYFGANGDDFDLFNYIGNTNASGDFPFNFYGGAGGSNLFLRLSDVASSVFSTNVSLSGNNLTGVDVIDGLDHRSMPYGFEQTWWNMTNIPKGMYVMNGTELSRTDNSECYAIFGLTFGNTSATTFSLPDTSGRNVIQSDTDGNFTTIGETGGEYNHTMTAQELVIHSHEYLYPSTTTRSTGTSSTARADLPTSPNPDTLDTGGSKAFNILDPYIVAGGKIVRC